MSKKTLIISSAVAAVFAAAGVVWFFIIKKKIRNGQHKEYGNVLSRKCVTARFFV